MDVTRSGDLQAWQKAMALVIDRASRTILRLVPSGALLLDESLQASGVHRLQQSRVIPLVLIRIG